MKLEFAGRSVARYALLLLTTTAVLVAMAPASAAAAVTKAFDAQLSLTGGCTVSSDDPVADPGCPEPPSHPPGSFVRPTAVATDFYGDMYVATFGSSPTGTAGKISIFSPKGVFITSLPFANGPRAIAIDSEGSLYVSDYFNSLEDRIVRFDPTGTYDPASGEIEYGDPPVVVEPNPRGSVVIGLAIDVENDHLFAKNGAEIIEYASAKEGNSVLETFDNGLINPSGEGLAVDAQRGLIYRSDAKVVRVVELASPHNVVRTMDGSTVPAGEFVGQLSIGVDEGSGDVFVLDELASKLYEFAADGTYLGTIEHDFQTSYGVEIGVDNGPLSPNGALNPFGRYVFVPSHPVGAGNSFAFGPIKPVCPPELESTSFANVSETEAELKAVVNPCNLPTEYTIEYTPQSRYEVEGWAGASVAASGHLPAGNVGIPVSVGVNKLSPGAAYRFRVVAINAQSEGNPTEEEAGFRTYPSFALSSCPNDAVRTGASALLADCRAFELVTPPDTNARSPRGAENAGSYFTMTQVSPGGDKVPFLIEGGEIPGSNATGSFKGDAYLATRGSSGWGTRYIGPNGAEAPAALPGGTSPDQGYSFWSTAGGSGTASVGGAQTNYVRYPDGHSALVGRGSLGTDPTAGGRLISANGSHIIFETGHTAGTTAKQLEPNAAPTGTGAIYDRTADEVTHVVSLLPGNVPLKSGEAAEFSGASFDGLGVGFEVGQTLYLRYEDKETFEIGHEVSFAGIAEGGNRIFYLEGGKLWRFDALTGERLAFNSTGTVTPVNVSADGGTAYFVSTSVLTTKTNPHGLKAKSGSQNLYRSREGTISFVGTVTSEDVEGEGSPEKVAGLGLWIKSFRFGFGEGIDSSRTTPDGTVLLFESRAKLTDYDPAGQKEVYRYDSRSDELTCLSCNPTGAAPSAGNASLQPTQDEAGMQLMSSFALIQNLRPDGQRAFFQSTEPLVAADTDGHQDVYEWEAQGVGSCTVPGGCIYLITSGISERNDYLFAVSESGDDVFFLSSDLLRPSDQDETPSIYDARVGGGFVENGSAECQGEGCRPSLTPSPPLPPARSTPLGQGDNSTGTPHCRKGQRRVKRHGKVRCVKKHRKHRRQRHHRAGASHGKGGTK